MIKQNKFIGTRITNSLLVELEAACEQRDERKSAFIRKAIRALLYRHKQEQLLSTDSALDRTNQPSGWLNRR